MKISGSKYQVKIFLHFTIIPDKTASGEYNHHENNDKPTTHALLPLNFYMSTQFVFEKFEHAALHAEDSQRLYYVPTLNTG